MAAGASVQFSDPVKLLSVILDKSLTMDRSVMEVARSRNFHIRALRHITRWRTLDAAKSVAIVA